MKHTALTTDDRRVTIVPYKVTDDPADNHWEYRCHWGVGNAFLWDSIECDNGVVAQQPHSFDEALKMGTTYVQSSTFAKIFGELQGTKS